MNVESDQRVISGSISRGFNYINYKIILGRARLKRFDNYEYIVSNRVTFIKSQF